GRYTVDVSRRLSLVDVDFFYKQGDFLLWAEGALAFQETSERVESKGGGYVQMSARVQKHLEPYLQYDFLYEQDARHRVLGGTAVYPCPESQATRTLRLKTEIGVDSGEGDSAAFVWLMQLTSGF